MPYTDEQQQEKPSKTKQKKQMTALQKLGEELAELSVDQIRKADFPPLLEKELLFAKTLKKHEAKRRHSQYLGKIIRDMDTAPMKTYLADIRSGQVANTKAFHQVEMWRDQLLAGDEELIGKLFEQFPAMDGQRFRQLVRNAQKEVAQGGKPKARRELFRMLRGLYESQENEAKPEHAP